MNLVPKENVDCTMQARRREEVLTLARTATGFRPDFVTWLDDNWRVWVRFAQEADKLRMRGREHYSARTIVEVLRHESALADTGEPWKLNDHNTPDLARLYLLTRPTAEGFFELRRPADSTR